MRRRWRGGPADRSGIAGRDLHDVGPIDRQADDDELRDDPVYKLDMAAHLAGVLRKAVADDASRMAALASALTPSERGAVERAIAS